MTELLENSDNTNADTGVSESPSNEATISLAAVQALADALQKIESYTPTVWVDNESPDIDAAHLNKAEQAIMRVTTAMNSAVDVIKDLQSQVNTTNNNLGNGVFKALTFSDFSASDDIKTVCQKMFSTLPASNACYRIRMEPTPNGTTADAYVYCASSKYGFVHIRNHSGIDYYGRVQNGTWSWDSYALKSDLKTSGVCIGGIYVQTTFSGSTATTKKFTPSDANSHMAGLLIVDQNNKTDVYSIGKLSGVQPLLKKSNADIPTMSSGVLNVPLVAWGYIAFISFDKFTIS